MFAVRMPHVGTIPKAFARLADARKQADGFLSSRPKERRVEVVRIVTGVDEWAWPVVWKAFREDRNSPVTCEWEIRP